MTGAIESVVEAYGAAWLQRDDQARRELLLKAWGDEGVYQDPTVEVVGRDNLVAHIGGFHNRFPGSRIEMTSGVDTHHNRLRFAWRIVGADGREVLEGIDFGEVGEDGRLVRIVGFFGPIGGTSVSR